MNASGQAPKKQITRCKAHRSVHGPCACYSLEVARAVLSGGVFVDHLGPRDGSPVAELLKQEQQIKGAK